MTITLNLSKPLTFLKYCLSITLNFILLSFKWISIVFSNVVKAFMNQEKWLNTNCFLIFSIFMIVFL